MHGKLIISVDKYDRVDFRDIDAIIIEDNVRCETKYIVTFESTDRAIKELENVLHILNNSKVTSQHYSSDLNVGKANNTARQLGEQLQGEDRSKPEKEGAI